MEYTLKNWFKILGIQLLLGVAAFFVFRFFPAEVDQMVPQIQEEIVEVEEKIVLPQERIINYRLVASADTSEWLSNLKEGDTLSALMVINRADAWRLKHMDTLVFPDTIGEGIELYAPFPKSVGELQEVKKIVLVSHYSQAFAVYENGERIKWGPVSLGSKHKPTPTGLFSTNWKSKRTVSTINSSWILEWYCNIDNYEGIGMHQYELPGYPASHGCVRMYRDDANWLYHWADQWKIEEGQIAAHGTPIVIFGEYPHGERKPWLQMQQNNSAVSISSEQLMQVLQEYLSTVIERQSQRDLIEMDKMVSNQIQ